MEDTLREILQKLQVLTTQSEAQKAELSTLRDIVTSGGPLLPQDTRSLDTSDDSPSHDIPEVSH
jgi:hypothetical protein